MTDVVVEREVIVLEERDELGVLVEVPAPRVDVVTEALQGPPGPPGPIGPEGGATLVTVGATPISGHTAVALDSGGLLVYADCTNAAHIGAVQGVVANAYGAGAQAVVQTDFDLVHSGWSFSPGPVLVGAGGALVQSLPPGALFAQVVAYALSPTRIRIDPQPPVAIT